MPLRIEFCGWEDTVTWSCLTITSLVPVHGMQYSYGMMAQKSRYKEPNPLKEKSVQCKVAVFAFERNKEKKKFLLPL